MKSNFIFAGDFDMQVDFNLAAWPPNNGVGAGIISPRETSGEYRNERRAQRSPGYELEEQVGHPECCEGEPSIFAPNA